MVLTQTEQNAVNYYWGILQTIPKNVKLGLVVRLTSSVIEDEPEPDNATMTKDDFFEMLDKSSKQAEEGKVHRWHKDESIEDYVKRIENGL